MTSHQFVAVRLCLYLITGIILGVHFPIAIGTALFLTVLFFLVLTILFKNAAGNSNPIFGILAYLTVLIIGMFAVSINNPWNYNHYFPFHQAASEELLTLSIVQELKPSTYNSRYIAKIKSIGDTPVMGKLLLEVTEVSNSPKLLVDNTVKLWGKPERIPQATNPGAFNYAAYMAKKGIYHRIRVLPAEILAIADGDRTIKGLAAQSRAALVAGLDETRISQRELSVIKALLLGYRFDLSESTYSAYRNSGAVHILAVSGLHVGILLVFLRLVLKPITRNSKDNLMYLIAQLVLLWAYAFITGLSPSVIRAVTMCSFLAYALFLNRPANAYNILALSVLFILLIVDPGLLFQVGFQMSYAAVIGILWLYPQLQGLWRPKLLPARKVKEILVVSFSAQAGVLPVSLFYFHQFPALFFISNLALIPLLGLLLGGGLIIIIWLAISSVPEFILITYENIIWVMNEIVIYIAGLERFTLRRIRFEFPFLILLYVFLILVAEYLRTRKAIMVKYALMVIVGMQLYSLMSNYRSAGKNELLVFHQFKESLLAEKRGLHLLTRGLPPHDSNILHDYSLDNGVLHIKSSIRGNCYLYNGQRFYIVDSLGIMPGNKYYPEYLLVTYSPKVNPERFLRKLRPALVIADGSNYPSVAEHWRKSCEIQGIPFHYTKEAGAFIISGYN